MSKLTKALDKYKKEHKLTADRIFSLDDGKKTESGLKGGKRRSFREDADGGASKPTARSYPPQAESIDSPRNASRKIAPLDADRSLRQPTGSTPQQKSHFILTGKQSEKAVTNTVGIEERTSQDGNEKTSWPVVSGETTSAGISLDKIDPNLISVLKPHSMGTEIFKVLRGKILFPASGKPPRSIMVTSAVPGEGKSFVASNLAVNMAQNIEDHVLLMDCDLRRPTIHRIFGLGRVKGLSEHLANGNKILDLLINTGFGKLSILPSGAPPLNPSEVLSSAKMANLLDELKSRYADRFIIMESPPPMLAPETSAIAKQVDAIIVVIRFGSTPMEAVEELIDNLGKEKIIGAVINRFDARTSRYYGYQKYGKYYRS